MSYMPETKSQGLKHDENAHEYTHSRKRDANNLLGDSSAQKNALKKTALTPLALSNVQSESAIQRDAAKNSGAVHLSVSNHVQVTAHTEQDSDSALLLSNLSKRVDDLQESVSKIAEALSFLVSESTEREEKEELVKKVDLLSSYANDCIEHNDALMKENTALKKENAQLKSEVEEYALLYRLFKDF